MGRRDRAIIQTRFGLTVANPRRRRIKTNSRGKKAAKLGGSHGPFIGPRLFAVSLVIPCGATPFPLAKEAEVNGVRLQYLEQGSGEPAVFVHGVMSDHRLWDPIIRDEIASKYRFIALTQRYFGTGPWKDDGKEFSVATFADDLAKFITSLNAGPVHLVGWSFGGHVATTMAVQNPSLVRSLVLYEASVMSVLPADSTEGKVAREDRGRIFAPAAAASKAGDPVKATRLLLEAVFQLPPGGSDREPQAFQTMLDDNARTTPLLFRAPPPPDITCDTLMKFTRPTLVMRGEKTLTSYVMMSDAIGECVPGALQIVLPMVNHDGPARDPAGFSAAVIGFLSKQPGL
jgi:pimeloyl-ACP methyl ester carboxylesterase